MKMNIYISHSVGCAGWNMLRIYEGTNFKLGCRTSRFKPKKDKDIQMLDWDYLEWKKTPEKIEVKHLEIAKEYDIETVMSMDLWDYNVNKALEYANKLLKYTNRVYIPCHYWEDIRLLEYDLAYPNANWFSKNTIPTSQLRGHIKHILGGSPQSQIKHLTTTQRDLNNKSLQFPNVVSLDGNQLFNCAIRNGKEWYIDKPYWRNHGNEIPNEQKFRNSVKRFDKCIKELDI